MESAQSLRCAPTRRSLKFNASDSARHFLAFDPSISKHDRMILYMGLFAFMQYFTDPKTLPNFAPARYVPEQYVELRVLTDPRHPAYGQLGLFAKSTIPANTVVTPYSGYIEIFSTSCSSRTYTMGFGSLGDDYALDAEFAGNYGRFANDPRGVLGLMANLTAESRFTPRGEAYTALVSRRVINKGEEILMSYGKAHSLTPSPWVGLKGELLTRHRAGGIVPFPQLARSQRAGLREKPARAPSDMSLTALGAREGRDGVVQEQTEGLPKLGGEPGASSAVADAQAEMVLLWECPQCGMWSIGNPTPVRIHHCFFCRSPRHQRARLVAVCCTPALSREDVLASVMHGVASAPSAPSSPLGELPPAAPFQPAPEEVCSAPGSRLTSSSSSASSSSSREEEGSGARHDAKSNGAGASSGGDTHFPPAVPFSSEAVRWPLNVPFLPWQVWDAAIPLSAIKKHARFETQENIFLYAVTTAAEEEHRLTGEGKRARDEAEADEQQQQERQPRKRGRKPRVRRKKEELWQTEAPPPNGAQQQLQQETDTVTVSASTTKCSGEHVPTDSSSATEYLFYVDSAASCGENLPSGDDDNSEEAAALIALQSLLKGVLRRVFAGKSYHCGEVVASVGGMILPTADRRHRPDSSVLEIPMKYFLPAPIRRQLGGAPARGTGETHNEMQDEEKMIFSDLLGRLEGLSLVVTNELMFCPCLVLRDEEDPHRNHRGTDDVGDLGDDLPRRHPLLERCNVSFVLTMDSLGCPYVAVVAVRDISTFEPLLASIGC
ncbi:uncharacterized protein Tco025E_01388 [Trypanosoma conorhini]|uniref:SET domain-containing protein n=1 Tax=Trypanosoma conorhini TaxID=83891 RepID=A0A422Q8F6_9TRYP|nr:uncharacterized protein Tco025E_01388 [Trypanosoma conorhini]RNF26265.1 hypothetical protein Tco025E_01388 [Trypanosoma conorhini]